MNAKTQRQDAPGTDVAAQLTPITRWNTDTKSDESLPKVDAFISDIEAVCTKHGLSISHEDGHGAFIIEPFNESNIQWMRDAMVSGVKL